MVGQHFSWTSVIWLLFASGKLMMDAKWPKLVLGASNAWTEGGEGEEGSKESSPHIVGSEKSMAFRTMLKKALKVVIECSDRMPACNP